MFGRIVSGNVFRGGQVMARGAIRRGLMIKGTDVLMWHESDEKAGEHSAQDDCAERSPVYF